MRNQRACRSSHHQYCTLLRYCGHGNEIELLDLVVFTFEGFFELGKAVGIFCIVRVSLTLTRSEAYFLAASAGKLQNRISDRLLIQFGDICTVTAAAAILNMSCV